MIRPTATLNRHIETLKLQLDETQLQNLDYLVISHADSLMVQKLNHAFANASIAVISIAQTDWAMDDSSINDLMDWAINELSIKGVLLAGSSRGGTPADSVQVCEAGKTSPQAKVSTGLSFLDRINSAQQCRVANEDHFLQQLNLLQQSPSISGESLRNGSLVQGLLYRAESGVFCYYDAQDSVFRALLSEKCIA